jgi:hypothetical protein
MNRRSFLKRLLGAAGAIAAGPVALKVAAEIFPQAPLCNLAEEAINNAWVSAPYEAQFIIPVEELMAQTTWYWNDLALKNLTRNVSHLAIKPYHPK